MMVVQVVESSIVCGGVVLRKGVRVERGSLLSFGVVVGQGVTVPPFSRICRPHPDAASTVRIKGGGGGLSAVGRGGWLWYPFRKISSSPGMGSSEERASV